MRVAVLIVGYRNAADVRRCIGALEKSDYRAFNVVICENGGEQAFHALSQIPSTLKNGQCVKVVMAPGNLGYAGGVNLALAEAGDCDAYWILNPDTVPEPGALSAMVERLARGDCDMVGGVLYGPDGRIQSVGGKWTPWIARMQSIGHGSPLSASRSAEAVERTMNFVSGASMLVSRRFLQIAGQMREDYFLYCEEVEWCVRGAKLGMRFGFAADARILHGGGTTTGSGQPLPTRPRLPVYLDERNKMLLLRDHSRALIPVAAVSAFALLTRRYLVRGSRKQFRFALEGWRDGLMGRRGSV